MSTRKILFGAAVTQQTEAVVSMLKFFGKPTTPPPQTVDLPGMVLVLSNKKDVYYTTSANSCSCPSAAYRPGQLCKHQRKYFPEKSIRLSPEDLIAELERLKPKVPFKPFLE
jgi:hypothetical protein